MIFLKIAAIITERLLILQMKKNPTKNTLLLNWVSTVFINVKPAVIYGLRKLRNPPSWLAMFLVVPFNEIDLISKVLFTFIIFFVSLFVRAIPEPLIDVHVFMKFIFFYLTWYSAAFSANSRAGFFANFIPLLLLLD